MILQAFKQMASKFIGQPNGADDDKVVYSKEAFASRERFRDNYKSLCTALASVLEFDSVLDVGCANGFVLSEMAARGKTVQGVEIAAAALEAIPAELRDRVLIADASKLGRIGDFDLVCCVEVAEHVTPKETNGLLDTIVNNARNWVYFTAASPYQPGHGHINCRQQFFWLNEFRKRGFDLDWDRTERLVDAIADMRPATWLPMNSLILRRR